MASTCTVHTVSLCFYQFIFLESLNSNYFQDHKVQSFILYPYDTWVDDTDNRQSCYQRRFVSSRVRIKLHQASKNWNISFDLGQLTIIHCWKDFTQLTIEIEKMHWFSGEQWTYIIFCEIRTLELEHNSCSMAGKKNRF